MSSKKDGGNKDMKDIMYNATLTPRQRELGLWLCLAPADSSILNLIYEGSVIKSFKADESPEVIVKEADKWLKENR